MLISSSDHQDHVRQHVGERTAQMAGPCMRRDEQPNVMMGLGTPRPCNESQWTGSTRPEDGRQKSHHSGKSIPNCREHVQGVSACKRATTAGKSRVNCRQEVCAGVAEQARGEEYRPCDRVHLHAERNDRVSVPELPWTATWSMK